MKRITAAVLASACLALALAGVASSTTFGVADDAGKYADDGGAGFFTMLTQLGMTENRMAVFWDPTQPNGQPRRALDTSRARELFGFEARTPLREIDPNNTRATAPSQTPRAAARRAASGDKP